MGYNQTKQYLDNHNQEAIYYSADSLEELFKWIPEEKLNETHKSLIKSHFSHSIESHLNNVKQKGKSDLREEDLDKLNNVIYQILTKFKDDRLENLQDRWQRKYINILKQDIKDNFENDLPFNDKYVNLLKILMETYYGIRKSQGLFSSELGNALEAILSKNFIEQILNNHGKDVPKDSRMTVSHRPEQMEKLVNLDKLATARGIGIDKQDFINTLEAILDPHLWEGKAESFSGRTNKIPQGVSEIRSILAGEKNTEQAYFKILNIAQDRLEMTGNKNSFFSGTRNPEVNSLYRAIVHHDLITLKKLAQLDKKNPATPTRSYEQIKGWSPKKKSLVASR